MTEGEVSPEDKFRDRYFDAALGPYDRPFKSLQETYDFQKTYGIPPGDGKTGPDKGVPKNVEDRKPRYLPEEEGAEGQSFHFMLTLSTFLKRVFKGLV